MAHLRSIGVLLLLATSLLGQPVEQQTLTLTATTPAAALVSAAAKLPNGNKIAADTRAAILRGDVQTLAQLATQQHDNAIAKQTATFAADLTQARTRKFANLNDLQATVSALKTVGMKEKAVDVLHTSATGPTPIDRKLLEHLLHQVDPAAPMSRIAASPSPSPSPSPTPHEPPPHSVGDVRGMVTPDYKGGPGLPAVGSFVQIINRHDKPLTVFVDGRNVGEISPGTYDSFVIHPGTTNIRILDQSLAGTELTYDAKLGRTVYFTAK